MDLSDLRFFKLFESTKKNTWLAIVSETESIGAGGRSTPIVFHIIKDKLINPVVGLIR